MRNKKSFITFAVVIVSFAAGIVLLTWNEPTDGLDMIAVVVFIFTGWYGGKFGFAKL